MKFLHHIGPPHCVGWFNQFMRIMRLTIIIIIIALMQVSAAGLAQKVNLSVKNAPLEQVLAAIKQQTSYNFVYTENVIAKARAVTLNLKDTELKDALKVCFENQPLNFAIEEQTIVISEKAPTFLERLANRWATIDVSGRVVDAEGNGIPGATVSVKGNNKSVMTGKNGIFNLSNVNEDAVLVISYIGYIKKEIKVSKDLVDIVLEQSLSKLDEVQVIAYGTTTQRLSTGNVTTIKADVIEKQPVNNPLLALQGRVPGLFIEQATGFAGTGVKVRIQGQNSLNKGSDPLYVIDGVPFISQLENTEYSNSIVGGSGVGASGNSYGNPLNLINPADIESIDVLKDGDATAIYGSRAANGAILITTKKGEAGDTRINFNLQSGWSKVPRKLKLLNTEQYLEMRHEALKNDGIEEPTPGNFGDNDLNGNWDSKRYTDWQNELIGGTARYQDLNGSISGGSNLTTFLVGVGHHKETNVFPGDFSDQKSSVHFSINNTSLNQKFSIQFSGNYLLNNNKLPNKDLTRDAMVLSPNAPPLYQSEGVINWQTDASGNTTFFTNPIGFIKNKYQNKAGNLISNLVLSYQILKGLNIKSSFGYNNMTYSATNKELLDRTYPENQRYYTRNNLIINNNMSSWTIEPQLSYNRNISRGKLEVLFGTTLLQKNSNGYSIAAGGFSSDLVMDDLSSATRFRVLQTTSADYKYNALFGRINYNWQDRYIVNLTGRRDGSSRFGPKSQFHNFAALGTAWIFSNEKLIKDQLTFLSFGKLRGSYGTTGSDQIGDYLFLSLYNPVTTDVLYQGVLPYTSNGLTNPYLQWEETKKLQFGLDLGFLKDRVIFNINYFANYSSNQLSAYDLPITTGQYGITRNQPFKIRNSGWEFTYSSSNFQNSNFNWKSSINLTIPKSMLIDYPDVYKSSHASYAIIGRPLTFQYVYHYLGVDPSTGIYQFLDKYGNPTTSPKDPEDKTVTVDLAPKFYGGFQNSFTFKNFQLDVFILFVKQMGQNYSSDYDPGNFGFGQGNQQESTLDRWRNSGDVVRNQMYTSGSNLSQSLTYLSQSDAVWGDASYVRLKNVALSWILPGAWTKALRLLNTSLFIQGQNLWTVTGYRGLDPETKSSFSLPPLRVISFGIKIRL